MIFCVLGHFLEFLKRTPENPDKLSLYAVEFPTRDVQLSVLKDGHVHIQFATTGSDNSMNFQRHTFTCVLKICAVAEKRRVYAGPKIDTERVLFGQEVPQCYTVFVEHLQYLVISVFFLHSTCITLA